MRPFFRASAREYGHNDRDLDGSGHVDAACTMS